MTLTFNLQNFDKNYIITSYDIYLTHHLKKTQDLKFHEIWTSEAIFKVNLTLEVKSEVIFGILSSSCII